MRLTTNSTLNDFVGLISRDSCDKIERAVKKISVLKLQEIEKPVRKDDEILLKVQAASVNRTDSHGLRRTPFMARIVLGGLRKSKTKILGYDFAG